MADSPAAGQANKKHYTKLEEYAMKRYSEAEWEARYRCMKDRASKLMKPGGPLAHLAKDQVTWQQVLEAHTQEKRARECNTGLFEDQPAELPHAEQEPDIVDLATSLQTAAEGSPSGRRTPAAGGPWQFQGDQQAALDCAHAHTAAEDQSVTDDGTIPAPDAGGHHNHGSASGLVFQQQQQQQQRNKRRRTNPVLTLSDPVTPEELEQVTPAHLLTTPLATWERNRLQNLLQAISARGAQLRSDHKALAKQVREHENKVSWAASTVDKGLSEVQVKLAAELLDHEAGSQLLGVASKLMEQAKVQVAKVAHELQTSPQQKALKEQTVRLQQQVHNMEKCETVVKEAMHVQNDADDIENVPLNELALQVFEPLNHDVAVKAEASQATAVTQATGANNSAWPKWRFKLWGKW